MLRQGKRLYFNLTTGIAEKGAYLAVITEGHTALRRNERATLLTL